VRTEAICEGFVDYNNLEVEMDVKPALYSSRRDCHMIIIRAGNHKETQGSTTHG